MRTIYLVIFLLGLISCGGIEVDDPAENALPVAPRVPDTREDTSQTTDTLVEPTPAERTVQEFSLIARQWDFVPGEIRVKQGDTVRLHITSQDVTHGIRLSEFNVRENLAAGETVTVEFVADKKGTFRLFCDVFCGSGHSTMDGQLIVE